MSHREWDVISEGLSNLIRDFLPKRNETQAAGKNHSEEPSKLEEQISDEDANRPRYEYQPLSGGAVTIRLLDLLPGNREDGITCVLRECPIEDCRGTYEALSYVWGDETDGSPLLIADSIISVTKNLLAALRDLRKPDQPRRLWVDAICIDQTNVLERNQQVSVMDEIYRSAYRTVVWLGPGIKDDTKVAYAMLEDLAAEAASKEHSPDVGSLLSENLTLSLLDRKRVESALFERYRDDITIIHLAEAPWWSRAWTVQEILLASHAVVVTGSYSMDWKLFCMGVDYGLAIGIWMPVILGMIIDPSVAPYFSMRALTQARKQPFDASSKSATKATAPTQLMLEMLIHCRFRQATDPRDKVYSLLSLAATAEQNNAALGLKPDYAAPTNIVYTNTAKQLLLSSDNLDLLGACIPSAMEGLPSWAPDWSCTSPAPRPLMHDAFGRPRKTNASGNTPASARFLEDAPILVLSGHEFTTVTALAPVLRRLQVDGSTFDDVERSDPNATLLKHLARVGHVLTNLVAVFAQLSAVVPQVGTFSDWEAFARSSEPRNPCPRAERAAYDPLEVYWRTLTAGAQAEGGPEETARMFYAWRAKLRPIARLHRWDLDRVLRPIGFLGYLRQTWRGYSEFVRLLEMVYERRLGRGENGFIGLLPENTEVGDKVFVIKGGRVPLVLRGDGGDQGYRLVGEAYIEGIMDGEAFQEERCVKISIKRGRTHVVATGEDQRVPVFILTKLTVYVN